jgi:hypothetical protein
VRILNTLASDSLSLAIGLAVIPAELCSFFPPLTFSASKLENSKKHVTNITEKGNGIDNFKGIPYIEAQCSTASQYCFLFAFVVYSIAYYKKIKVHKFFKT